jgi:AmiR/NasT family two-component response regulator
LLGVSAAGLLLTSGKDTLQVVAASSERTRLLELFQLQHRAIHDRNAFTAQVQTALNSRVLIEQAKGLLTERHQLPVDDAFILLCNDARGRKQRLAELAWASIDGS